MNKKLNPKSRKELEAAGVFPEKNYIKPVSHRVMEETVMEKQKLEEECARLLTEVEAEEQYMLSMPATHLEFCDHYVNGDVGVAGDARQSYIRAFQRKITKREASAFLRKKHIAKKIKELYEEKQGMLYAKRIYIEEKLEAIVDECVKAKFRDRYGNLQSPAAMRSVAVNALKTLNDMNGFNAPVEIKDNTEKKTGIHFNLIMPDENKE